MNYLAHAFLARPTLASLTGNLLGDFCKGLDPNNLPQPVYAGLQNHRAVDRFTDQHPLVRQARQQFSSQRRRFAGVALDVLFDHYLIRHWALFSDQDFMQYKAGLYQQLQQALPLMPLPMARVMDNVSRQDWLRHYQQLDGIARVLDTIAGRLRFNNAFAGIITEITPRYSELEQLFLQFFPQLQQHIVQQALEQ